MAPESVRKEVALFCSTPVIDAPRSALMVVTPAPVPLLVMVPPLLTAVVDSVVPPAAVFLMARSNAPVRPPVKVNRPAVVEPMVLSANRVMGPAKLPPMVLLVKMTLPVPPTPAPLMLSGSAEVPALLVISKPAPDAVVVPAALSPGATPVPDPRILSTAAWT